MSQRQVYDSNQSVFQLQLSANNFNLHFSQDEEEEEEQDETKVTSTLSDSDIHNPRKNRVAVRKYPFSHPFAHLDPNFSWKTSQHTELRKSDGGGSNTGTGGSDTGTGGSDAGTGGSDADVGDSHKRPREVLIHPTLLLPKAGLFRQPLNPKDPDYQDTSSDDDASESPDTTFVVKAG
jgi:hypothetical protein